MNEGKKINFSELIVITEPSKNMTGATGEYFVCGELGKINILALLTPKNNPLFDVVASNPEGTKSVFISVKTMGVENSTGWRLSMELTQRKNNPNLYVVLVNLKLKEPNEYYVYHFDELVDKINANYKKYIDKAKRDGSKRKDLQFRWFNRAEFTSGDRKRKNDWTKIQYHLR